VQATVCMHAIPLPNTSMRTYTEDAHGRAWAPRHMSVHIPVKDGYHCVVERASVVAQVRY
jgi:hypothetical protein